MIPRYGPTFSYSDLKTSLDLCRQGDVDSRLCARLAEMYGLKHVFLFESARVALFTALRAYARPGKVLMPAYNCIVVPEAVQFAGYQPEFVDIDPDSLNMEADSLEKAITADTTAVLATHLFGIPCALEETIRVAREHHLLVIEDAAPALGAEYHGKLAGSFGDAVIISFQATKVISGEAGGALLTNQDELAEKITRLLPDQAPDGNSWKLYTKAAARKLATAAWFYPITHQAYRLLKNEQMFEIVTPQTEMQKGFFQRCSPFSSGLVMAQLDRLPWNLERRRRLAQIYQEKLSSQTNARLIRIVPDSSPAWIQFPVIVENKQDFYHYMASRGIDLSWTYRYSCADSYQNENCPNAQRAARTVLGLPTYPSLSDEQAQVICEAVYQY